MKKVIINSLGLICLLTVSINGRFVDYDGYSDFNEMNDIENLQKRESHENRGENSKIRDPRLSEAEWSTYNIREPNGPGTFAFGYDNAIDPTGNEHYRSEEKLKNGTIVGEYGYTDNSIRRIFRVYYTADHRGYRARTEILPF